jgi:hypothetical protein
VVTGAVTITAPASIASLQPPLQRTRASAHATLCWLPAGIVILLTGATRKRFLRYARLERFFILLGLFAVATFFAACGGGSGGGGGSTMPQSETGTLTITAAGSTGNVSQTAQITVTVN